MKTIYIYRSYITDDEETMNDKIFDLLSEDTKSISAVEAKVESEWDNVEEEQCSVQSLFDYMRNGYIFLDHCGKE